MAVGPLAIAILFVIAVLMTVLLLTLPRLLTPRKLVNPEKVMPYESGMDPIGDARHRFDVRFHLVAIVFLIFDVELLFLYPWAVAAWAQQGGIQEAADAYGAALPHLVLAEVLLFVLLLFAAYVYAWRRRVFDWR